jgi:hypothetical protein
MMIEGKQAQGGSVTACTLHGTSLLEVRPGPVAAADIAPSFGLAGPGVESIQQTSAAVTAATQHAMA